MGYEITYATEEDIQAIPIIQNLAFTDRLSLTLFPRGPSLVNWLLAVNKAGISNKEIALIVIKDTETKQVIGYAKWELPKHNSKTIDEALGEFSLPTWPADCDAEFNNVWSTELRGLREKHMGLRPHWYLILLAVHPDYQGKGIGAQLLKWGLSQADKEGVETYLESTPYGVPVYERYGFVPVSKIIRLEGTHQTTCMIRQPVVTQSTFR